MPEPQVYAAAEVALKTEANAMRDYVPPKERPEERDPIWNFEQIPSALQEQTDLRGWMLKAKEARIESVKTWARGIARRQDEDAAAWTYRKNRIRRALLFVIGTEASSPLGTREVAAEAFKVLFPKE